MRSDSSRRRSGSNFLESSRPTMRRFDSESRHPPPRGRRASRAQLHPALQCAASRAVARRVRILRSRGVPSPRILTQGHRVNFHSPANFRQIGVGKKHHSGGRDNLVKISHGGQTRRSSGKSLWVVASSHDIQTRREALSFRAVSPARAFELALPGYHLFTVFRIGVCVRRPRLVTPLKIRR